VNAQDRAILSPPKRVATESDFTPEWIANVRGVIQRDGHKLRAGFPACIDVLGPNGWQPLNLPTNGIEFTGKRDRDVILRKLTDAAPSP